MHSPVTHSSIQIWQIGSHLANLATDVCVCVVSFTTTTQYIHTHTDIRTLSLFIKDVPLNGCRLHLRFPACLNLCQVSLTHPYLTSFIYLLFLASENVPIVKPCQYSFNSYPEMCILRQWMVLLG
jgi:hypothetical protein